MKSLNGHNSMALMTVAQVWYQGTEAIKKGEGLCYNVDKGTATEADGSRLNFVEKPSSANNKHFAGVALDSHSAPSGNEISGILVEIALPGSLAPIAVGVDTVIDTGIVTCSASAADAGRFGLAGLPGRGSAIPLQTVTAQQAGETDGTGSIDGDTAGDDKGKTLTGAGFTDNVEAGDTVVIVSGEDDGDTDKIVPGEYIVASVTSDTELVLKTSACHESSDAALACSYYVVRGNPTCLALLMDGEESGLQEVVTPPNAGHASDNTFSIMKGGKTYINGGVTIATDNGRAALADGDFVGQKKAFECLGTLTTNDAEIELATAGKQLASEDTGDGTGGGLLAMAALTFDAADELAVLEWQGIWQEAVHNGAAIAAS